MRFDLPSRDRLRLAVIARRQRAWDAARDGPEPNRVDVPFVLLVALFAVGSVTLLVLAAYRYLH